ncbi:hypothetical protein [Faecalibacterium sp. 9]
MKKRTPPIHTGHFPGRTVTARTAQAGDAVGRADCKLPLAGMCGYSAEAF